MSPEVPRYLPPSEAERAHTIARQMTPRSTLGATRDAQPVVVGREVARAGARSIASAGQAASNIQTWEDIFTLAAAGAQSVTLTYLPTPDRSEDVKLNTLGQTRDVDWSRSGQTLSILAPMDARANDELKVQYTYLLGMTGMPQSVPPTVVAAAPNQSDLSNVTPLTTVIPAVAVVGNTMVLAVAMKSHTATLAFPTGWVVSSSTVDPTASLVLKLWVATKTVAAGDAGSTVSIPITWDGTGYAYGLGLAVLDGVNTVGSPVPGSTSTVSATYTAPGSGTGVEVVCSDDGTHFTSPTGSVRAAGNSSTNNRTPVAIDVLAGGSRVYSNSASTAYVWAAVWLPIT